MIRFIHKVELHGVAPAVVGLITCNDHGAVVVVYKDVVSGSRLPDDSSGVFFSEREDRKRIVHQRGLRVIVVIVDIEGEIDLRHIADLFLLQGVAHPGDLAVAFLAGVYDFRPEWIAHNAVDRDLLEGEHEIPVRAVLDIDLPLVAQCGVVPHALYGKIQIVIVDQHLAEVRCCAAFGRRVLITCVFMIACVLCAPVGHCGFIRVGDGRGVSGFSGSV